MSEPSVPAGPGRPRTDAAAVRGPGIGVVVALALATAGLQAAIVALAPTDQARTIVFTLAIWFQGAWALMLWRRPERDLIAIGLVANVAFLVTTVLLAVVAPGPTGLSAAQLLAMVGQGALVACCAALLSGRRLVATPRATMPLAAATGLVAVALAAASLAFAAPQTLPGTSDPVAGGTVAGGAPARSITNDATPAPSATGIALSVVDPARPSTSGELTAGSATAGASAAGTNAPVSSAEPTTAAVAATTQPRTPEPSEPAPSTSRTSAPPAAATSTPAATAATAQTPEPTAPPTARPSPTPRATPAATPRSAVPPTPRPTPTPAATRTPTPTAAPTPTPTPIPTPSATVAPGNPGTIAFGSNYDPQTLALINPTRTIHIGQQVAWRADLTEPAGGTTLTFTVTEPLPSGKEFPHWQQDFGVADPSFTVLVKRVDMSAYVHDEPGSYIMRIRRGADGEILAEGTFTVLP